MSSRKSQQADEEKRVAAEAVRERLCAPEPVRADELALVALHAVERYRLERQVETYLTERARIVRWSVVAVASLVAVLVLVLVLADL